MTMELVLQTLTALQQPFGALSKYVDSKEFANKIFDFAVSLKTEAKNLTERIEPNLIAEIYSYLDITSLDSLDNEEKISQFISQFLNQEIATLKPAAFCVFPVFIETAKNLLKESQIKLAVVESAFPHGQSLLESRIEDLRRITDLGADEVDAVIRRGLAIANDFEKLEQEIASMKAVCADKKFKIILNTQELPKDNPDRLIDIYKISKTAITARADMLKSSTGKEGINADLEDCIVMCRAIQDLNSKTGFKAAGGIKTLEAAVTYYLLAKLTFGNNLCMDNFRIGASSLAGVLQKAYLDPKSGLSAGLGEY